MKNIPSAHLYQLEAGTSTAATFIPQPKISSIMRRWETRIFSFRSRSNERGSDFIPLRGERDEEYSVGASLPVRGWDFDGGYFHTATRNFFDHEALGNSNIFFPLTIERARIRINTLKGKVR